MKLIFRILESSFTDRLAYISAGAGALCWVLHARYPAIFPGQLKETMHVYVTVGAALAAGLLIAKYVLKEGYARSQQETHAEKEALAVQIQGLEKALLEIKAEKDQFAERELALRNKLKNLESNLPEAQLSSLRKKIRLDEEGKRTSLAFLVHDLRNNLQELDHIKDPDIVQAAAVLKKETQLLEDEIKRGDMSLYDLVLKAIGIKEDIYDLTLIRLQSIGGKEDSVRDYSQPHHYSWFDAETDPTRVERIYKFLKVAFHPDRFSSDGLKKEAKIHFQEAMQAYSTLKERLKTTH